MLVMKTDYSKILNKMMLKCEASFLKCEKCEVKYSWYDPQQGARRTCEAALNPQ